MIKVGQVYTCKVCMNGGCLLRIENIDIHNRIEYATFDDKAGCRKSTTTTAESYIKSGEMKLEPIKTLKYMKENKCTASIAEKN